MIVVYNRGILYTMAYDLYLYMFYHDRLHFKMLILKTIFCFVVCNIRIMI